MNEREIQSPHSSYQSPRTRPELQWSRSATCARGERLKFAEPRATRYTGSPTRYCYEQQTGTAPPRGARLPSPHTHPRPRVRAVRCCARARREFRTHKHNSHTTPTRQRRSRPSARAALASTALQRSWPRPWPTGNGQRSGVLLSAASDHRPLTRSSGVVRTCTVRCRRLCGTRSQPTRAGAWPTRGRGRALRARRRVPGSRPSHPSRGAGV